MRQYEKSEIRKGMMLYGGVCAPDGTMVTTSRRERDQLQRQFPEFKEALQVAGLSPEEQRLAEIAAGNREIEERVAAIKEKVAALLAGDH